MLRRSVWSVFFSSLLFPSALLQLMVQSRCSDWIVILGYMIGNADAPAEVFRTDPNRYEEFSRIIQEKKWQVPLVVNLSVPVPPNSIPPFFHSFSVGYQEFSKKVEAQMTK